MNPADVSIIMATRNAAGVLPDALASIREHAPNVRVHVWDGESTDATLHLLQANDNVQATSGPDQGIYDAFQKALHHVKTPFIYFMGADDRLRPEWRDAASQLTDPETVYYGNVWLTGAQKEYDGSFTRTHLAKTNICQQAVFYPAQVLTRHPFVPHYPLQADWELNMWCWHQPDIRTRYLPLCVCDFNDQTGSSSTRYDDRFNADYPALIRSYFGWSLYLRYGLPAMLAHRTRALRRKQ